MEKTRDSRARLIDGLSRITGISKAAISKYAETQDVLHVIDHPMVVGATDRQHEKIVMLREFLNAYQDLRDNEWQGRKMLDSPKAAEDYFRSQLAYYREREIVLCAFINSSGGAISCEKISQGTINCSSVFPREILKRAIQLDACSIILAHNHPGGSTAPSKADIELTTRLYGILKPLDITVCDHIIIGQSSGIHEGKADPSGLVGLHGPESIGDDSGTAGTTGAGA